MWGSGVKECEGSEGCIALVEWACEVRGCGGRGVRLWGLGLLVVHIYLSSYELEELHKLGSTYYTAKSYRKQFDHLCETIIESSP